MALDPVTAISDVVNTIITRVWPDRTQQELMKGELAKMAINGELQAAAAEIQLRLAQIDVNKIEAASESWLKAGWRPACGWIGAFSLGYAAIVEPVGRFVATVMFSYGGSFPILDSTLTMQILFGILGLGVYRTVEKVRGTK